jgi:hypothetical protein
MTKQNGRSSRRSPKSDAARKKAKALQRAIRKTEIREPPTVGKPVIKDPSPETSRA